MKKSLIVSHISSCDYPLWRLWLRKYSSWFDEIIIYFDVQFRYPFFWSFIQQDLSTIPNIKFLDPVQYDYETSDWRTTSTNELIKHATGDWIFSIEQDWFAKDWGKLLDKVNAVMYEDNPDMIGWLNPTNSPYIHPAFFAIKREMLEKTSKDFSAHPEIPGSDHFAMITYDVQKLQGKIVSLQDMGFNCNFSPDADMFHLGGVNQNYLNGLNEGFQFHRPEAFRLYNLRSLESEVEYDDRFVKIMADIAAKLVNVEINPEWNKFFTL